MEFQHTWMILTYPSSDHSFNKSFGVDVYRGNSQIVMKDVNSASNNTWWYHINTVNYIISGIFKIKQTALNKGCDSCEQNRILSNRRACLNKRAPDFWFWLYLKNYLTNVNHIFSLQCSGTEYTAMFIEIRQGYGFIFCLRAQRLYSLNYSNGSRLSAIFDIRGQYYGCDLYVSATYMWGWMIHIKRLARDDKMGL